MAGVGPLGRSLGVTICAATGDLWFTDAFHHRVVALPAPAWTAAAAPTELKAAAPTVVMTAAPTWTTATTALTWATTMAAPTRIVKGDCAADGDGAEISADPDVAAAVCVAGRAWGVAAPQAAVVGADGRVWVIDGRNHCVRVYS